MTVDDSAFGIRQAVEELCRKVLAPLLRKDGGTLYLVEATNEIVRLHLGGELAGCPSAELTKRVMLEPLIRHAAPRAQIEVTTGFRPPAGIEPFE